MVNKKVEGMSNAKHFMDERECEQTCKSWNKGSVVV